MTPVESGPWNHPVNVEELPDNGEHFDLVADEATRQAVARATGLRSLPKLEAAFDVTRRAAGVKVTGTVTARIGQTCVVTLEPIESDIAEEVELVFAPGFEATEGAATHEAGADDPPEPLENGTVDLGAIATEFLVLAIDPYPRKPGVAFEPPAADDASAKPFAALQALKDRKPQ